MPNYKLIKKLKFVGKMLFKSFILLSLFSISTQFVPYYLFLKEIKNIGEDMHGMQLLLNIDFYKIKIYSKIKLNLEK